MSTTDHLPFLGFGLGLRTKHYPHIVAHWPEVDWFEIISENFMETNGRPKRNLARIRERYPIIMHGVSLSIGTVDPLNSEYLKKLKALADWLNPPWISDHLCWTGVAHKTTHDLLPMPYTEEALQHVVERIRQVQEYLGRRIALENPSTYLEFNSSTMPEAEFIARMAEESDCHLLLDVNNVYVSSYNHRLDAKDYLDTLPLERVIQIHLSGHANKGTHIIDTHDDHVADDVWTLYQYAISKAGRTINTMIEWDDNIPEFEVLYAELMKAKALTNSAVDREKLPDFSVSVPPYRVNRNTPLTQTQHWLQQAIMQGNSANATPKEWIRTNEQLSPQHRLDIYTEGYRYRLSDNVAEEYPVLAHALGEKRFNRLLTAFINKVPPDHFNAGRYPWKLPAFLTTHPEGSDKFMCELAQLEQVISELADAKETEPLTPEHLAGITPETLMQTRLDPRAALKLLVCDYPINAYYRAVQEKQSPTRPLPEKTFLAVFRHDDEVWRLELAADEYALLSVLFSGITVGAALEAIKPEMTDEDALSAKLSHWFARWMHNGLLATTEPAAQQFHKSHIA